MAQGNSLSQLLCYADCADSEEEDNNEVEQNSMNSQVNNLIGASSSQVKSTEWTKCYVKNTEHPYYWNTVTKEVTWDIPGEYENYIHFIEKSGKLANADNDKYWSECFSEENIEPYYVNKITRVVSYEPPEGFNKTNKSQNNNISKKKKKNIGKPKVKKYNWKSEEEIEEKIELIDTFISKSDSSSDEDNKKKPKHLFDNDKSIRSLLVPQYDDFDSDGEKSVESKEIKQTQLFPFLTTTTKSESNTKISTTLKPQKTEPIYTQKIYSLKTDMNNEISCEKIEREIEMPPVVIPVVPKVTIDEIVKEELNKSCSNISVKIEKPEDEKINSLEESVPEFDVKTFQRKRRIEFLPKTNVVSTVIVEKIESGETDTKIENIKKSLYTNFKKGNVEYESNNETADESKTDSLPVDYFTQIHISEIQDSGELIKSKLKFLSKGSPVKVTSVQTILIQYETLFLAYESKNLTENYLLKWIRDTTENLTELEKDAVPDGWRCEWERKNSRYCYINLANGKKQLDFPSQDIFVSDDEMDICTTPPPIIEDEEINSNDFDVSREQPSPPPPPIISEQHGIDEPIAAKKDVLGFELESFYSDIAGLEQTTSVSNNLLSENKLLETEVKSSAVKREADQDTIKKKVKKIKVQGITSKMKDISGMVAKWQKVQRDLNS